MCQIYDADGLVEILQSADRKARKDTSCDECYRPILRGEVYRYEFGKYEGQASVYRTCRHCMIAREWLLTNCDGFIYSGVLEDIGEHARDYHQFGLYRIVAGARRKWRNGKGDLMPLPKMPPPITIHH